MSVKFNIAPYFDDFETPTSTGELSPKEKYNRILFRPAHAVQARELTQIQSTLQNQVSQVGNHLFKDGSMVIPGNVSVKDVDYVRVINSFPAGFDISSIIGKSISSIDPANTSDVLTATIIAVDLVDSIYTLYIQYQKSATTDTGGQRQVFEYSDTTGANLDLEIIVSTLVTQTVVISPDIEEDTTNNIEELNAIGTGTLAFIEQGIYFIKSLFVVVQQDQVVISPFSSTDNTSNFDIGLQITESIATSLEDESLNDNATGSSNENAPGAHRYKVSTSLVKTVLNSDIDGTEDDFLLLVRIENGIVTKQVRATDYAIIEETLARRTYDESGNYTVKPFMAQITENSDNEKFNIELEPAKAYVHGYEIETLATKTLELDKARATEDQENAQVQMNFGNYIDITDVTGLPDIQTFQQISIYDDVVANQSSGAIIAWARVRSIRQLNATDYRVWLFDVDLNQMSITLDSTMSATQSNALFGILHRGEEFELNISHAEGAYTVKAVVVSYNADTKKLIFTQNNPSADGSFKSNNTACIFNSAAYSFFQSNTTITFPASGIVVDHLTLPSGGIAPFSDAKSCELNYTGTDASHDFTANFILTGATTGATPKAVLEDPQKKSLVFKLPYNAIKSCDTGTVATPFFGSSYSSLMKLTANPQSTGTGSNTLVSLRFQGLPTGVTFNPLWMSYFVLVDEYDGTVLYFDDQNYSASDPDGWLVSGTGGNDNSILDVWHTNLAEHEPDGITDRSYSVITRVDVNSLSDGTTGGHISTISASSTAQLDSFGSWGSSDVPATLGLSKPYGHSLTNVYHSIHVDSKGITPPNTTYWEDVTEHYEFNDGQTDSYYDNCYVNLKRNSNFIPTNIIVVEYNVWVGRTPASGKYFSSVDSYWDGSSVSSYDNIPSFDSATDSARLQLRDCVDFRPDIGSDTPTICPLPESVFSTNIRYYTSRLDKIYLDKTGNFGVTQGVSSLSPELPDTPKESMVLYHAAIPAYTFSLDDVNLRLLDNRRYTMRDIGSLEKRINSLEYYTALSLLESEAVNKDVYDATGLRRVKSGFLVDSFNTHKSGNVLSPEYRAAIDRVNHTLRPLFVEKNVALKYGVDTVATTTYPNGTKTGDLVTLPWAEEVLFDQDKASGSINVNPYDIFDWVGEITLSPSSDQWKDTINRPTLVINQTGIYDALMGILDATDALGTVWNSWQTNWTGSTSTSWVSGSGRNWQSTTTETETTQKQSRTGIETAVVPGTMTTNIGERVVEVNFAPFARSRRVSFNASRLKPNTKMYAYFDNKNISNWTIKDQEYISYTDSDDEIMTDMVSNYGADFTSGNGELEHPQKAAEHNNKVTASDASFIELITDASGNLTGSFWLPNTDSVRFKAGTRRFKLTDKDPDDATSVETTFAATMYTARGLLETKENVTISTRLTEIEQREVADDRVVVSTSRRTRTRWWDPLAQSFLIDTDQYPEGLFLTSIDLYFKTKSDTIPVTLQIREMNQGIPTQNIIPFSNVTLQPSVDSVTESGTGTAGTKFEFSSPVYLQSGVEYCFIVMANSIDYECYYASIGGEDIGTQKRISKQPYAGVLFTSQNASTWTPDQNKDLKFTLNRAKFSPLASVNLKTTDISSPNTRLYNNPITTIQGENWITVHHKNHGFLSSSSSNKTWVIIKGVTGDASGKIGGIDVANINKVTPLGAPAPQEVYIADQDSFRVSIMDNSGVSQTALATDLGGGGDVYISENILYNVIHPNLQFLKFSSTNIQWGMSTYKGSSAADIGQPYPAANVTFPIVPNENVTLPSQMMIGRRGNGITDSDFANVALKVILSSDKDYISPIIDLERCSVTAIQNRINSPGTNSIFPETDPKNGEALAKYVTKNIKLKAESDTIRMYLDVNRPSFTDIEVYYRTHLEADKIDLQNWIKASPLLDISVSDSGEYEEVEYNIEVASNFSIFAIKIVSKSTNTSRVPTCKDLRIIAAQV